MAENIKNITAAQDEETKKQIQDLVERLSQAQSAEELAAICKETGCEIPLDKAQELYAQMEKRRAAGESGELTDEELESVNGGFFISFLIGLVTSAGSTAVVTSPIWVKIVGMIKGVEFTR